MNSFNSILKDLRIEKGLSQKQLGLEFGVLERTVSYWEVAKESAILTR